MNRHRRLGCLVDQNPPQSNSAPAGLNYAVLQLFAFFSFSINASQERNYPTGAPGPRRSSCWCGPGEVMTLGLNGFGVGENVNGFNFWRFMGRKSLI